MSKSNTFEDGLLNLIFLNTALANIGDTSGIQPSSTAGYVYLSLFVSDPTDEDTGTEASYTGYERVAVARNSSNWDVTDGVATNKQEISFPESTGTTQTVSYLGIHTASTGGDLIYSSALGTTTSIPTNFIPIFYIGSLSISED